MGELLLGILAAMGASTLYSLGIALQALNAKEAPQEEHLRLALAWGLLRRARWLAGTGLSILGWALQIVALMLAPLAVAQAALVAGPRVLMRPAERLRAEHAGRYEHTGVWAIVIGMVGAALTAPPHPSNHASGLTITLAPCGLCPATLL